MTGITFVSTGYMFVYQFHPDLSETLLQQIKIYLVIVGDRITIEIQGLPVCFENMSVIF
jgi:hypothetical protein